jgi:hypothetical protein
LKALLTPRKSFVRDAAKLLREAGFREETIDDRLGKWAKERFSEERIYAEFCAMLDLGVQKTESAIRAEGYLDRLNTIDIEKEPKYVKMRPLGKKGRYVGKAEKLRNLHIVCQRLATEGEKKAFKYYQNLFDLMHPEERRANSIHRPQDLIAPGDPLREMVYFTSRRNPLINETMIVKAPPLKGEAGDNLRYFQAAMRLIDSNEGQGYETFYIAGEYGPITDPQFRTLTARTEFQVRRVRHRKPKQRR